MADRPDFGREPRHVPAGRRAEQPPVLPAELGERPEHRLSRAWTNWPLFTLGLVQRGYPDRDVEKILGGNVLHVARAALRDFWAIGATGPPAVCLPKAAQVLVGLAGAA